MVRQDKTVRCNLIVIIIADIIAPFNMFMLAFFVNKLKGSLYRNNILIALAKAASIALGSVFQKMFST